MRILIASILLFAFCSAVALAESATERIQRLQIALQKQQQGHQEKEQVTTLLALATAAVDARRWDEGAAWAMQAGALADHLHDTARAHDGYKLGAVIFGHLLQIENAEKAYALALERSRQVGDRASEAEMLYFYGRTYTLAAMYTKSVPLLEKAIPMLHELHSDSECDACTALAADYYRLARFDVAEATAERALAGHRKRGDWVPIVADLNLLGEVCTDCGHFARATACLEEAYALRKQHDDPAKLPVALNNLAGLWVGLGQYDKAIKLFQEGLQGAKAAGDFRMQVQILTNLAMTLQRLERWSEALDAQTEALDLCKKIDDRMLMVQAVRGMAQLVVHFDRLADAASLLEKALGAARKFGSPYDVASACFDLGMTYLRMGRVAEGRKYADEALALHRQTNNRPGEAEALDVVARYEVLAGRIRSAVLFLKLAVNLHQEIRGQMRSMAAEVQRSYARAVALSYHELADLLIVQGRVAEAQQVISLLKDDEFNQFTRGAAAPSAGVALSPREQDLQKRYDAVAAKLIALSSEREKLMQQPDREKIMDRLIAIEKDMRTAREAFEQYITAMSAELEKNASGSEKIAALKNLDTLQEELRSVGPGAVVVYTIVGEHVFHEILVTPDVCKTYDVRIEAADLNRKVLDFRETLQNPRLDPRPAGKALYDVMLSPALAADLVALKATTVMWSLDGALRYVPVNALYDGARWQVEVRDNTVFTNATAGSLNRMPSAQWKVAALGVSRAWDNLPPLPGVPDELKAIVKGAGGGVLPGTLALDPQFTEKAFEVALLSRSPVIHIASHFNFVPGDETRSFLLLGDGSKMTVADMKGLDFEGVDLLTLSACNTASGSGEGKEIESFAMLAQRHKARAVIASLWPVSDGSTPALMAEFYKLHGNGMSRIAALQEAQRRLLDGRIGGERAVATRGAHVVGQDGGAAPYVAPPGKPFAHPFYWAPFILMGNWR